MRLLIRSVLFACVLWPAVSPQAQAQPAAQAKAIFAGGCFWCMEHPFDIIPGVISTSATGHTEAVQVMYDPKKDSYQKLLETFWRNIDPTVRNRQFCDIGTQYRSGIFYLDDEQKRLAEASRSALEKSKPFKEAIVTEITRAAEFWPAEEYHQDYYLKNPLRYKY